MNNKKHRFSLFSFDVDSNYISERQQYVDLLNVKDRTLEAGKSQCPSVTLGVHQGSLIGPVLFLIYLNYSFLCTLHAL